MKCNACGGPVVRGAGVSQDSCLEQSHPGRDVHERQDISFLVLKRISERAFAEQLGTLVPSIYELVLQPDRLTPMLGQTAGLAWHLILWVDFVSPCSWDSADRIAGLRSRVRAFRIISIWAA